MGPKLFNAVRLYIDGVRDGHLAVALDKYVAEDLIAHTPGIAHGRCGLADHLEPLVRTHNRRVVLPVRGFEDGSRVFLQTFHSYGPRQLEQVSIDIFDTDEDHHITEHWQVTSPLRSGSRSGYSQIDGPRNVTDPEATAKNKILLKGYADEVLLGNRADRIGAYLADHDYAQHDPDIAGGLAGHLSWLEAAEARGAPVRYTSIDAAVGAGNFVALTGRREVGRLRQTVAHLFRVEHGRIVEHWNTAAPIPD